MAAGGVSSPSNAPSSIYERSAANTNSQSSPVKQLPGSINVSKLRALTSRRLRVRFQYKRISRTSQCSANSCSMASASATRAGSPTDRNTQVPISPSLNRKCNIASSSSRASANGQNDAPAAWMSSGVCGSGVCGPEMINAAVFRLRSISIAR